MESEIKARKVMNSIVPISRFNKGEASKIFSEVKKSGVHIVVKNNVPECVLISPLEYEQLMDEIEDAVLFAQAMQRLDKNEKMISHEDVMSKYGISQKDLDEIDVELE